jgi:kynurenine formamidase
VRIVDLTHSFDDGMPVFPGLPEPSFQAIANVPDDGYAMTDDVSGREPGPIGRAELEPRLQDVRVGDIVFMYSDNSDHLNQLPDRVQVVVAPMKLRNSNGAPARILAHVLD